MKDNVSLCNRLKNINIFLILIFAVGAVGSVSCKSSSHRPDVVPPARPQPVAVADTVLPNQSAEVECRPVATEAPDFESYYKSVLEQMAVANKDIFSREYAPALFCLSTIRTDVPVAAVDVARKHIIVSTGLLFLKHDGQAVDLAVILAQLLAQVLTQAGEVIPSKDTLPQSVDIQELDRRIRLQAIMRDRQRKLFEEIASEAVKDDVAGDYRWFYKNAKHIERELGPLLNKRERTSFAELKPAIAVIDQDSATLDNLQVGTHLSLESGLIVRSGQVAEAMVQKFHRVKGILHKPLSCQDGMPCNTIAMIGRLSAYYGNRVKRRIEDLKSINLEHRDDPLRYEPYAQWVEHRVMGLSKKILVEAKLIPSGNDARLKMTTLFDQSACQNEIMVGGVSIAHQTNFICLKSILSLERPETISPGATPSHIADQFERYKKLYELQTKYKHKIDFM